MTNLEWLREHTMTIICAGIVISALLVGFAACLILRKN